VLRVLQEQEFERLGSTHTHRVDVRIVAATNQDLADLVANKQFRSVYDLGEGRIAAMDAAGIDVQILSYATPSAERLEPSLARGL
jgi:sigma54-dependent transcription regulator